MSGSQSELTFYPPRAGRFSRFWYFWFRLKQVTVWRRMARPEILSEEDQLLSLVLPGYIFVALGFRKTGIAFIVGYFITLIVTLAAIGMPQAAFGWGLMLSAQAICILHLLVIRSRGNISLLHRIGMAFLVIAALAGLVYMPVHHLVAKYVAAPLYTNREFIVVNPRSDPDDIRLGDTVAYHVEPDAGRGYRIEEGANYGKVLAEEGDRVVFFSDRVEVNGIPHAPLRGMPHEGEITVEPGSWFIWPAFIFSFQFPANIDIPTILRDNAIVSKELLIGKPYTRWFMRDQSHLHQENSSQP